MYTCTFHLTRTNCTPHTQPGRGVVIIAPPTVRYSEQFLYAAILRRASHCVRYPEFGGCPLFGCFYCIICMETAVGACNSVRYSVDVRYWECPLIESPLYLPTHAYLPTVPEFAGSSRKMRCRPAVPETMQNVLQF